MPTPKYLIERSFLYYEARIEMAYSKLAGEEIPLQGLRPPPVENTLKKNVFKGVVLPMGAFYRYLKYPKNKESQ